MAAKKIEKNNLPAGTILVAASHPRSRLSPCPIDRRLRGAAVVMPAAPRFSFTRLFANNYLTFPIWNRQRRELCALTDSDLPECSLDLPLPNAGNAQRFPLNFAVTNLAKPPAISRLAK